MSRLAEMQTRFKQRQLQEKEDKLKKLLVHPDQQTTIQTKTVISSSSQKITSTGNSTTTSTASQHRYGEVRQQKAGIDRSYPLKPLKVNNKPSTNSTIKNSRTSLNTSSPLRRKSDFGCDDAINENVVNNSIGRIDAAKKKVSVDELDEVKSSAVKKPLKVVSNPVPKARVVERRDTPTKTFEAKAPPRASPPVRASPQRQNAGIREVQSSSVNDNLVECKTCGRRFLPDRLEVHEKICTKTSKKKRKTYDALKHRVQGTDLEPFAKRPQKTKSKSAPPTKKYNWKQTHEEFINAIRAAKQAQAHLAKGGKLSDLPPPPPSSNPDYVQCPNCGRKFNETAAARHIPKCATYSFNKPKGAPGAKVPPAKTRAMR